MSETLVSTITLIYLVFSNMAINQVIFMGRCFFYVGMEGTTCTNDLSVPPPSGGIGGTGDGILENVVTIILLSYIYCDLKASGSSGG